MLPEVFVPYILRFGPYLAPAETLTLVIHQSAVKNYHKRKPERSKF